MQVLYGKSRLDLGNNRLLVECSHLLARLPPKLICIFDVCFSSFLFTPCFRETLLGQLTVYVKGIRDDFISKTQNSYSGGKDGGGPPQGRNMPEIVNNIVWVRQLDSKVGKPSLYS